MSRSSPSSPAVQLKSPLLKQHRQHLDVTAAAAASAAGSPDSQNPVPVSVAASSEPVYSPDFVRRRLMVFFGIVIGYSSYYLTRNSLTYTAPVMVADPRLGMDITQIGAMTSIFPIAYGMSKFISGVVGARFSPTLMLAGGLMLTAAVNIAFGFGTSLTWFCFFWALNGTLQGVGGPCCARILTTWFASKERGTYWGMWNIAHNLGGFAAPLAAVRVSGLELGGLLGSLIAGRFSDWLIKRDTSGNGGNVGKRVQVAGEEGLGRGGG
ncbi:MFS domain-containing protein [Haematococcus lacustris]|uniref:MFS domain-containing protein n=1 Tax=Haematococcus lacustris TaxID=44745 RepID=A0A699Y8V0_HAELA|nr:MFS domain-containing protein [Haematococcus lacustris]